MSANIGNKPPSNTSSQNRSASTGNTSKPANTSNTSKNSASVNNKPASVNNKPASVNNKPASVNNKPASVNNKSANAENLSELLGSSNTVSDMLGINQSSTNTSGKNQSEKNNGGLFGNLLGKNANNRSTTPSTANGTGLASIISTPAETLVSTTETAIKSASNKISEVKESVSDRIEELSSGTNIGMNLLKIGLTILVLVALFFVAKYLFTRYQDSVYSSPMLLDGMKNSKHALVISQDPANPSYVPMPKSDNQSSLEFTYDFWMLIDSYEYKKGEWKHVFHKGNSSSYPNRAPGIWLHPDTNAMRVYMNTQDNILEYVDVDNLPLRKWIHISLVLHDMDLDVFVNGYLKKRQKLTSVPKLNNGDFWVNMFGGFEGYLARIRYYARAIGVDEIAANVRAGPGNSSCIDTGQVPPYLDDDWWLQ